MAEYKCICCGEIKDSENSCTCPNCGYKMFEMPYDRRTALIGEITSFIRSLQITSISSDVLEYKNRKDESKRFPDFNKIQDYVAGQEKTEEFLEALRRSVEQIQLHYRTPYSKEYEVSYKQLENAMQERDTVLTAAVAALNSGKEYDFAAVEWPEATLFYSEIIDKYLVLSVGELLDAVGKLSEKIEKFIKFYNLYGSNHKIKPKDSFKLQEGNTPDYKDLLEKRLDRVCDVLNKEYSVDIFDDGSQQLKEMMTCLWNAIQMIMRAPILIPQNQYVCGGEQCTEDELLEKIADCIKPRYEQLNADIMSEEFLSDRTDDELMERYNGMIELDSFGYLAVDGSRLLHIGESEKKLNKLIGLSSIKESIAKIKAYALANKSSEDLNIHMCFYGNPGTGKTEVARIIAKILHENKILPTDKVVEVDRGGLVGQYVGETPQKAGAVIQSAMGGVLFIDEAYSLVPEGFPGDYGHEAVATLIKAMEDYRGKFCVILAGYENKMHKMISSNPGFKSRIQFELAFPNYSRDELKQILKLMLEGRRYSMGEAAMNKVLDVTDVMRKDPDFANARALRNILDQTIMCQNLRVKGGSDTEIGIVDVNKFIRDSKVNLPTSGNGMQKKILTGEEELDQLIGLDSVKRMVKKIKAYAKRNKDNADFNIHMCFYGNPGTGKTEVARIISRILHDAGVLEEAKLVETDAHGLMGKAVGETAPKTLEKIEKAMNGVLFIDEAYSLAGNSKDFVGSYGEEAIEVLLKEMEDRRGQFCAIIAGYKDEMNDMIKVNPGLKSRIQFTLEFPDYSREELGMIASKFLDKKKYVMDNNAMELFLDITDYFRNQPNFANARTVRNILDQVIMNQNLRTEDGGEINRIIIDDVKDYINDEGLDLADKTGGERRIGFL